MNDKYTHAGHSPVCFTQEDACQKAEIEALRAQVEALTEKAANYEMDLHAAESRVEALAAESEVEEALSAADHMEYGVSTANNCAKNLAAAYRRVVAENERLRQAIENNAKYHAGKPCGDCAENDAEKAAVEAVVEAAMNLHPSEGHWESESRMDYDEVQIDKDALKAFRDAVARLAEIRGER